MNDLKKKLVGNHGTTYGLPRVDEGKDQKVIDAGKSEISGSRLYNFNSKSL